MPMGMIVDLGSASNKLLSIRNSGAAGKSAIVESAKSVYFFSSNLCRCFHWVTKDLSKEAVLGR